MAEFYVTLPTDSMAAQIAGLLNAQNKLLKAHTVYTIMRSPAIYFVELSGNTVIGCTGLIKEFPKISKSFHTSVIKDYQGRGLGKKLLTTAINNCSTEYIYGTIRSDNTASLSLVRSLGFGVLKEVRKKDHNIIVVGRYVANGK